VEASRQIRVEVVPAQAELLVVRHLGRKSILFCIYAFAGCRRKSALHGRKSNVLTDQLAENIVYSQR